MKRLLAIMIVLAVAGSLFALVASNNAPKTKSQPASYTPPAQTSAPAEVTPFAKRKDSVLKSDARETAASGGEAKSMAEDKYVEPTVALPAARETAVEESTDLSGSRP